MTITKEAEELIKEAKPKDLKDIIEQVSPKGKKYHKDPSDELND
jgi:hypothetical protein